MYTRLTYTLFVAFILTTACPLRAEQDDPWSITLFRSRCYGSCPNYEITIFANGRVKYNGYHWVEVKGVMEGHIDPSRLLPLFEKMREIGFWSYFNGATQRMLPNGDVTYTNLALDVSQFWIRAIGPNGSRKITFWQEKPLNELGSLIDSTADDARWIGHSLHQ
jgi:hypothetical protein